MSRRQNPIDKMRELADDGLEPWQIAAALGVREQTVLVALEAREPAGGAQRAVEDALSLVPVGPSKPDTLAPSRPMTAALVEHVAAYAGEQHAMVRRCYCTPHPCSCDHEDGNDYPAEREQQATAEAEYLADVVEHAIETGEPLPPDPAEAARRARDEAADRILDQADAVAARLAEAVALPDGMTLAFDTTPIEDEHVHDPFPVVDEAGVWHAECECGHRWDRAHCEYSGCTAYVAALHIARTGTSRHAHHPPA